MNFRDYKWFNNPRGLRNNGPYTALNPDRYSGPKMGWAKLVVGGTEHVDVVPALMAKGCMPIVQIYRERMGAAPVDEAWYAIYEAYHKAGVMWFELYDEPNMEHFWPLDEGGNPGPAPDWVDRERCIGPLMDHWLDWAERIAAMGAYPAFPAMAETIVPEQATVAWIEACLSYLAQTHGQRFSSLIANGLWVATHPYVLNHFYQEPPGGPPSAARPYYQQSYKEGGWHFEYPFDPLQQHDDPGRTPFGGTASSSFGDPNGLIASGEIFTQLLRRIFAAGPVPVIGTAGGIWPVPAPDAAPIQADSRYYGYSRDSHAEATVALFRWLAEQGPPWLFGLALSSEADYYGQGSAVPAIELLLGEPPTMKDPPDLDIPPGRVVGSMPAPAPEPSPLDPFTMAGEAEMESPETAPQPEEMPEPDMETFLTELDMAFSEPEIPPTEPEPGMASPEPETPPEPEMTTPEPEILPEPEMISPEPEQPVTALLEQEPPITTLITPEPHVTTLAEHEPTITTLTAPEPAAMPPEPEPEPEPEEEIAPTSVLWPAPEAVEEVAAPPDVIAMPAGESAPEPVLEEVAPLEPEEEAAPTSVLWPAPEAREEVETSAPQAVAAVDVPAVLPAGKLGPGPGPAHDIISDHWLMPAPDLPPDWLLRAARGYWDTFRVPIVADASLIGALPPEKSLAVTLIAPRAGAEPAREHITAEWPNVRVDVVAGDTPAEIQAELDRRVREGKEFG